MRINSKDLLFGQPILRIRGIIRIAMQPENVFLEKKEIIKKFSDVLMQPKTVTNQVFEQMLLEGYLLLTREKISGKYYWRVSETEKGHRLGVTRANPPITRIKADELLKELIERVEEISSNKDLLYKIERIKVFGSYLAEGDILGDIDVAFRLKKSVPDREYDKKYKERIEMAIKNGRHFSTFLDEAYWPMKEVIMMLKTKRKGLSLHDENEDEVALNAKGIIVYQNHDL